MSGGEAPYPCGLTITRLQGTPTDDPYSGMPSGELDWSNPARTDITGCSISRARIQGASSEYVDVGREQLTETLTVTMPPDTALDARDRVEFAGKVYEVVTPAFTPQSPFTGWRPGAVATVQRKTG